jgi:hypothetical protein
MAEAIVPKLTHRLENGPRKRILLPITQPCDDITERVVLNGIINAYRCPQRSVSACENRAVAEAILGKRHNYICFSPKNLPVFKRWLLFNSNFHFGVREKDCRPQIGGVP